MSIDNSGDEMEAATSARNITDLDNLCLEKICGYLDIQSLFNAANTNTSLQAAAVFVYARKFDSKGIELYGGKTINFRKQIHMIDDTIFVANLRLILPYLRLFGASITKLRVKYSENGVHSILIDQYIDRYCAGTLSSILFRDKAIFSIDFLQQFGNVESVCVWHSALHNNLHRLINWFPNMRRLEIDTASICQCFLANVQFPHLTHLNIGINSFNSLNHVEAVLSANAQLESLDIYAWYSVHFTTTRRVLRMIRANSLLTKLVVSMTEEPTTIADADAARTLIRRHPLLVELDLPSHQFTADDALRMTRELNSLRMLRIQIGNTERRPFFIQLGNEWRHVSDHVDAVSDSYYITLTR